MDYYSATTNSYDDDSRHDRSMWSPHYASTTASSSRSSDSSYPSDDESGSTHYYTSEVNRKVDYNESSHLSLFARTLKEQDDLFYSTFPDARPANYQFLSAFPPGSFRTASPTETVALTDILVTPPNNSHYEYHTSATRPLLSTSDVHNDHGAYRTLRRATGNPDHDSSQITAATSVLETTAASPLISPPALVASQRQADIPMAMDTSTSLQEMAQLNGRIDPPRKESATTDHPLLQVSTQDANLIASSPSHTVSPPDTPPTPTHGFPTESGRDDPKDLRLAVAGQYPWPYPQRHLVPLLTTDKLEAARAYPSPSDSHVEDHTFVASAVSTKHAPSAPSSPSVPANDAGPPKLVPTRSPRRLGNRKPVLACLFCRGRKIACGPPVPGGPDNACNQCQRRSLKCEFPCENRRGAKKAAKNPKSRSGSENS